MHRLYSFAIRGERHYGAVGVNNRFSRRLVPASQPFRIDSREFSVLPY